MTFEFIILKINEVSNLYINRIKLVLYHANQ